MLALLTAGIGVGSTYSMHGLINTAIVYSVLWGIEKYLEVYFATTDDMWVLIFSMSALFYYIALQINMHPEFLIALF